MCLDIDLWQLYDTCLLPCSFYVCNIYVWVIQYVWIIFWSEWSRLIHIERYCEINLCTIILFLLWIISFLFLHVNVWTNFIFFQLVWMKVKKRKWKKAKILNIALLLPTLQVIKTFHYISSVINHFWRVS